jgi:hypothetical protein
MVGGELAKSSSDELTQRVVGPMAGDSLRQIRNSLQHPREVTEFCDSLQHLAASQQPESGKDLVVEHKGLSDEVLAFSGELVASALFSMGDK